jgi:hypothetical protein
MGAAHKADHAVHRSALGMALRPVLGCPLARDITTEHMLTMAPKTQRQGHKKCSFAATIKTG